ncbi:MAG: class I SAM-dependent methyltransferase [Proteobacteria bacterium]|nr:class I SAM-dependent methyltransferase [Pseudomonadota bacterium]
MSSLSLAEKIEHLGPWQHLIEFEPGVYSIPRDQWGLHKIISAQHYIAKTLFPILERLTRGSFEDKTVVDIGCMDGWLSLLFQRHGFRNIVGIDGDSRSVAQACFVKEYFGLDNLDFICTNVEGFHPAKSFDISLLMGVINHVCNPVEFLQRVFHMTHDFLIMDFDALLPDSDYPSLKDRAKVPEYWGTMACHFEQNGPFKHDEGQRLVFQYSRSAIIMMLQSVGFCNIMEIVPRIAIPDFYRRHRVFLYAEKQSDKAFFKKELALESKYNDASAAYLSDIDPIAVVENTFAFEQRQFLSEKIIPGKSSLGPVEQLKDTYRRNLKSIRGESIYVWGTSGGYEMMKDLFEGQEIEAFIDSDPKKAGQFFEGRQIISPVELKSRTSKPIFICSSFKEEICEAIRRDFPQFTLIP